MILWSNLDGLSFCVIPFHCQEQLPTATNHRDGTSSGKYREPDDTRDESLSSIQHFWDTNHYQKKILYFVWSPPWHLYIFLLANLLAFYLTYLLAFYLAFYLAYLLAYALAYLLAFYLANLLAFYLTYLLAFYLAFHLAYLLAFYLAVEVRQCPLGSGARGWGPAVPTGIWSSRLRSGSAHCDLQLAVEVRQCPLGSGARGGGPAVPTGIWTARRRRRVRRRRRRRRRRALLKSSNPHLAGGEQHVRSVLFCTSVSHFECIYDRLLPATIASPGSSFSGGRGYNMKITNRKCEGIQSSSILIVHICQSGDRTRQWKKNT